jgi:glycosyltransferase involved in cell wall biosynthesis
MAQSAREVEPMKQIAVVIPLYNHAAYIGDAIRSVLAQTRAVDKIVIVDDGSTDDSVEIVRTFAEPRIELYTQPNAGAHAALNRGIEKAVGCDYVSILNSDDVFARERISKCAGFLDETPAIDVVATRLRLIDSTGSEIAFSDRRAKWFAAAWSIRVSQLDLVEQLGVANFISSTSNLTGRTAYFLNHPFRHYRYAHDYFFVLHCALHNRLAVLDDELFSYRVHSTNTISANPEKLVRELLEMNVDLLAALAPELAGSPNLRRALAAYHRAAWGNVSSFRADVFVSLIAYALNESSRDQMQAHIDAVMKCSEASEFPNKALINLGNAEMPLRTQLAEKYSRLQGELAHAKAELSTLRRAWRESRWSRLGRKLGIKSARKIGRAPS